jgi:hypothetical protein
MQGSNTGHSAAIRFRKGLRLKTRYQALESERISFTYFKKSLSDAISSLTLAAALLTVKIQ